MKALGAAKRCWVGLLLAGFLCTGYYVLSTSKYIKMGHEVVQRVIFSATTPSKRPPLTFAETAQRFEKRRTLLRQACDQYDAAALMHTVSRKAPLMILKAHWPVMNVSVRYCPIQKTGSTTWSRMIGAARKQMKQRGLRGQLAQPGKEVNVSFLFVRDPYSRLLSAYVDKLFCPNTLFWRGTGRYIVQNFRSNPSPAGLRCGHDVTFLEYVRYVVSSQKTLQHRNGHFVPTHDHCDVCKVNYSYIGHLETLGEDMPFLLNVTKLPHNDPLADFDRRTIANNARWVLLAMKSGIRKCMTMHEACLRLWKKWHIRGILSKKEPLPVTAEEAENISMTDFVNLALQALTRSRDKQERRRQKTEALREAFSSIPPEVKLQVRSMLTLDFALFGFDPTPEAVFPSGYAREEAGYSYFDVGGASSGLVTSGNDSGVEQ